MIIKKQYFLVVIACFAFPAFATKQKLITYVDQNKALVSFDVSMPVDATGFTLKGKNLKGGVIHFQDRGAYLTPLLAVEEGNFDNPTVFSPNIKPLIKTHISYHAIKFINPNGTDNLFIKIGIAQRTETVSELDPYVLKPGTYTWQVPFFARGRESDTLQGNSENQQFIQIGTGHGPSHHNGMYTIEYYLYAMATGNLPISAHPQRISGLENVLEKATRTHFNCAAKGIWGGGGSDPYRTMQGDCHGFSRTFPAGPNLDYEYGTVELPTVLSPWTAAPEDHCMVNGKEGTGCTNIKIASKLHYMAQKIRVPLKSGVVLTASAGTVYRQMNVDNLRYQCKDNVYLENILPKKECLIKSYLPGGWSAPFFSVGYEYHAKDGKTYIAQYMYIPEKENSDRLAWRDASATRIYFTGIVGQSSKTISSKQLKQQLGKGLKIIEEYPALSAILVKNFYKNPQ